MSDSHFFVSIIFWTLDTRLWVVEKFKCPKILSSTTFGPRSSSLRSCAGLRALCRRVTRHSISRCAPWIVTQTAPARRLGRMIKIKIYFHSDYSPAI